MRAEHGNIFPCFHWVLHLKVMSFKAERNPSKGKVLGEASLFPLLAASPARSETSCQSSKGVREGDPQLPAYSSQCTFSLEPQEGILTAQYVALIRKMNSPVL